MNETARLLALITLGGLPAMAWAQTSAPASVDTYVAINGPHAADIHWLAVPAGVLTNLYSSNPQSIAASVVLGSGTAQLGANLSASTQVFNTPTPGKPGSYGHLVPRTVPTWTDNPINPTKQTAFGRTGNYDGLTQAVAIGNSPTDNSDKFIGTSKITFDQLDLIGPDSRRWSFKLVTADAESTNEVGEYFQAQTTGGDAWEEVAALRSLGGATAPKPADILTPSTFQYSGGVSTPAYAQVMATRNPTTVSVTLAAGTRNHTSVGSGNTTTAQSMAIGVWPLVPEVTVDCPAVTPAAASQACTVTVVNPPRDAFTIALDAPAGVDPASSCLAPLVFTAGQTTPLNCTMQMPTGAVGTVAGPSQAQASTTQGWVNKPGTVKLFVNTPPVAKDDNATTPYNTPLTLTAADLVASNDTDADNDPLTITSVQSAQNGTVVLLPNGDVVFTPTPGYFGADASYTYTISDGKGGTSTATVKITIPAPPTPPVAVNDSSTTPKDTPLTLPGTQLLANDSDINGDPLTITSVQDAVNGSVTFDGTNVVFTPAPGYTGPASFTYTISDGNGGTATATVNISVGTAATPVPVGGSGLLALMTALLAAMAGWRLRQRRRV